MMASAPAVTTIATPDLLLPDAEEPQTKKQKLSVPLPSKKKSADICHIRDFSLLTSGVFGDLTKSAKCNIVPLCLENTRPIFVQLEGGGSIPVAFGVDRKEGEEKTTVTFEIGSDEDHKELERLTSELRDLVCNKWGGWFPDTKAPAPALLADLCNPMVGERKKKRTGDGMYPGMTKASFDMRDLQDGKCKIINADTKERICLEDLPGMKWKVVIVEFKFVYILSSKSYGMTRRLRYISCEERDDELEIMPL
jgi:hypothetical protein